MNLSSESSKYILQRGWEKKESMKIAFVVVAWRPMLLPYLSHPS